MLFTTNLSWDRLVLISCLVLSFAVNAAPQPIFPEVAARSHSLSRRAWVIILLNYGSDKTDTPPPDWSRMKRNILLMFMDAREGLGLKKEDKNDVGFPGNVYPKIKDRDHGFKQIHFTFTGAPRCHDKDYDKDHKCSVIITDIERPREGVTIYDYKGHILHQIPTK